MYIKKVIKQGRNWFLIYFDLKKKRGLGHMVWVCISAANQPWSRPWQLYLCLECCNFGLAEILLQLHKQMTMAIKEKIQHCRFNWSSLIDTSMLKLRKKVIFSVNCEYTKLKVRPLAIIVMWHCKLKKITSEVKVPVIFHW